MNTQLSKLQNTFGIATLKNSVIAKTAILLLAAIICYNIYMWKITECTDNAYIAADMSLVSGKVSGTVTGVSCRENQFVNTGDVLFTLDDVDYRAAYDKSRFALDIATQIVSLTISKIEVEKINVEKLQQTVQFAKENYDMSAKDYARISNLASSHFSSRKFADDAKLAMEKAKLDLSNAEISLKISMTMLASLNEQKLLDEKNFMSAEQNVIIASNSLENTKIKAPISGVISNIGARVGNFVSTGQTIAAIVPTNNFYVIANFKETQIAKFRVGSKASIMLDGIPNHTIIGVVKNISPASGSTFSLIPANNATGNFTKIVQRFPVNIDIELDKDILDMVRVGMSANVSIRAR